MSNDTDVFLASTNEEDQAELLQALLKRLPPDRLEEAINLYTPEPVRYALFLQWLGEGYEDKADDID